MNISYNWLKDLIDLDLSPEDAAKALTRVGLAVEGIHPHGVDSVFDVDLTSNRPDCLSHLGVARELGVSIAKDIKLKPMRVEVPVPAVLAENTVRIDEPQLCHRFTARIIKGVKIGPSPKWLVDRLEAIGERSINNVADITNYVMHELGQPMHAFDLDKLSGERIVVRLAREGEILTTLDEVERKIDPTMLMICDAEKPVSVAGVMGGLDSAIGDKTVNVLLEVAYFNRDSIRATSRKLRLSTEASYRFERGVDVENVVRSSNRATDLICELAGGTAGDLIDVYPTRTAPSEVESVDISAAVKRLTGLDVPTDECHRILGSLGLMIEAEDGHVPTYIAPSWRHDIHIEEDLVEEVARHAGYENIATELPPAFGAGEYQPSESREKRLRQTLVDSGFNEALSYSFIDTKFDDVFAPIPQLLSDRANEKFVTLQDAIIEGAVRMRPSVLPGLLDSIRLNFNHKRRDLKLFEIGKVFAAGSNEDGLPNEQESFGLAITGSKRHANIAAQFREFDFYDAKGAVEAALEAAGIGNIAMSAADIPHLRKGQSATISVDGEAVGSLGRLNDEIAASFKFKQPVFIAEINLQMAMSRPTQTVVYRPLAKYPGIERDVSFVVRRNVTFAQIKAAVVGPNYELCRSVEFVDIFEGKGLADDERSITIRLEYRSDERTLVDDEVESVHTQIVERVEQELDIHRRF